MLKNDLMQKKRKKKKKTTWNFWFLGGKRREIMSKEFHFAIKNKNKGFHTEYRSFEQDK